MKSCSDLKEKEVLFCSACGIELEVKKTCNCHDDACEPVKAQGTCCEFSCCGKPMEVK